MSSANGAIMERGREDRLSPAVLAAANINPVTRLATDYLNHFNTVVMLLELVRDMPEFAEEILAWKPATYPQYFATSHFRERDLAVAAYQAADPSVRARFDASVGELDAAMAETQALLAGADPTAPATAAGIRILLTERLQPLIAHTSGIVNAVGTGPELDLVDEAGAAQETIDELFP